MKRIIFLLLCVLAVAAVVSAQTGNPGARPGPEPVTISGNLGITGGMITLESGGSLYYVTGLNRVIGFIDGLKEGAAVNLTGYAFEAPHRPGTKVFRVIKLDLNGKSYDLAPPAAEFRGPGNEPREWGGFPPGGNRDRGPGRHRRDRGGPDGRNPGRWD